MSDLEYHLKFPKTPCLFMDNIITFSINHIKSRHPIVVYFKLNCYGMDESLIYEYTSEERWVINSEYSHRHETFTLPQNIVNETAYNQIILVVNGVTSENPLYFNECMLQEKKWDEYHAPNTVMDEKSIFLSKSTYVNLYNHDGSFLQVIRPNRDSLTTKKLTRSSYTILAPHLVDESDVDDPINLFLEFINQTDQRIDILR